jgi:hypothetical protein
MKEKFSAVIIWNAPRFGVDATPFNGNGDDLIGEIRSLTANGRTVQQVVILPEPKPQWPAGPR